MKKMIAAACAALFLGAATLPAQAQYYTINGQPAPQEVQVYMYNNGLPPGHYWLMQDGNWGTWDAYGNPVHLGNVNASGQYQSHQGSGAYGDGYWNHYTENPTGSGGFGVGGTPDGCIYTTSGWSNC